MNKLNNLNAVPKLDGGIKSAALLVLPLLLLAIIELPVLNHYTLAEEDLTRMMSALVYGAVNNDASMTGYRPYGITFSFG